MNQQIFNINPRRLGELVQEVIAELGGDEAVQDLIRKEKASLIENIFRGCKLSQCYDPKMIAKLKDPVTLFDQLYECDLDTLEALNKAIDKRNTEYMRQQVTMHNMGLI